jgi:hypothetical protein
MIMEISASFSFDNKEAMDMENAKVQKWET